MCRIVGSERSATILAIIRPLTAALVVAIAGCFDDTPPPLPPPDPEHDLVIEQGVITYNGRPLVLGEPVATWTDVLGPPSTVAYLRIHVYRELGISLWEEDGRVTGLDVDVVGGRNVAFVPDGSPEPPATRLAAFPGRFVVEGVHVSGARTVSDMRFFFGLPCDIVGTTDYMMSEPGQTPIERSPRNVSCGSSASSILYKCGSFFSGDELITMMSFIVLNPDLKPRPRLRDVNAAERRARERRAAGVAGPKESDGLFDPVANVLEWLLPD